MIICDFCKKEMRGEVFRLSVSGQRELDDHNPPDMEICKDCFDEHVKEQFMNKPCNEKS